MLKRLASFLILTLGRYKVATPPPTERVSVMIAAPHTSNWDFPLMLAMAWRLGLHIKWLGKKQMFVGPLAPLYRAMGGVAVDRDNPGPLVDDLIAEAKGTDQIAIVIPAEGTRTKGEYWKSGFYRIANGADIPILPSYLDGPTRSGGVGPAIDSSQSVGAVMDDVRAFYADKMGVKPANRTEPRLREEDATED